MRIDRTHRPWALATLALFVAATLFYLPYSRKASHGAMGGSTPGLILGTAGFALMVFAGLLAARKKFPVWRLGRAQTWMRGHIWLGLLAYPLILYHSGFSMRGPLTATLMVLFTAVVASGIFGVLMQHYLPSLITVQVPLESVFEQIGSLRTQMVAEADRLVEAVCGTLGLATQPASAAAAAAEGGSANAAALHMEVEEEVSAPLREFYLTQMRPYMGAPADRKALLYTNAHAEAAFRNLRILLPPRLHPTVLGLENICTESRQLTRQKTLHLWLHLWLLVHVPLSYALLLLATVHAVAALRY